MNDFNKNSENDDAKKMAEIFKSSDAAGASLGPFFKTRVLAQVESAEKKSRESSWWKRFSLVSSLVTCLLVIVLLRTNGPDANTYKALVDSNYVVKIDVQSLKDYKIAYAKIDLPGGVQFYSKSHPELGELNSLEINWQAVAHKDHFPLVIRGQKSGLKAVKITFYDEDMKIVSTKEIKIRFDDQKRS
ncbi:MAG: hypothetical protein HN509_09075 [Halobacteriovoraceae bacterium]|jgi:hypothetical protein|nr:hypothetical protein [Halobacteriovoraceae bacterium]MBT5094860.1 hypothetical protein [Halobacteriovoraceae bacterium]